MCVQIAKHIVGASKVIGISSSPKKCRWVESLGADVCVNYHDADYQKQLSDIIGDDYGDVYYDNVGGEILIFMLSKVKNSAILLPVALFLAIMTQKRVSHWLA